MTKFFILAHALVGICALATQAAPLDEYFGYVEVRPGAHMFWVTYETEATTTGGGNWTDYPLIMWLQGGPGASGVGYGNFEELGPYDVDDNMNLRPGRWTLQANLMFVDNPVGTGYSYVDDLSLLTTTNQEIADDLVALLKQAYTDIPDFQTMPFFVYAESYGGKMTVDFALALDAAITNSEINCNFQGVALGDSWISPIDSVSTWGPFLYNMGMVNSDGQAAIDQSAANIQTSIDAGDWVQATNRWFLAEAVVNRETGGVNFYNVLTEENIYILDEKTENINMRPEVRGLYKKHVAPYTEASLEALMNSQGQKDSWNIPANVTWGGQSGDVFNTLNEDFMKPVIASVVALLDTTNIHVAVFTGDLDLICDTPGTYFWIENMQYSDKPGWDATERTELFISAYSNIAAYVQRKDQFSLFTILRSGHMVPVDAPEMALQMVSMITQYGADTVVPQRKTKLAEKATRHTMKEKAQEFDKELPLIAIEPPPQYNTIKEAELRAKAAATQNNRINKATPTGKKMHQKAPFKKGIRKPIVHY